MRRIIDDSGLGYLGNPLVKRDGVEQNYTAHELEEYKKCMANPAYFAKNYAKIINLDHGLVPFDLYPYQDKMFKHFQNNKFSIVLACRQSGKCQSIDTIVKVRNKKTGKIEEITVGDLYGRASSEANLS
jgi:hypothetical protein